MRQSELLYVNDRGEGNFIYNLTLLLLTHDTVVCGIIPVPQEPILHAAMLLTA